jgi:hypothetical protein
MFIIPTKKLVINIPYINSSDFCSKIDSIYFYNNNFSKKYKNVYKDILKSIINYF